MRILLPLRTAAYCFIVALSAGRLNATPLFMTTVGAHATAGANLGEPFGCISGGSNQTGGSSNQTGSTGSTISANDSCAAFFEFDPYTDYSATYGASGGASAQIVNGNRLSVIASATADGSVSSCGDDLEAPCLLGESQGGAFASAQASDTITITGGGLFRYDLGVDFGFSGTIDCGGNSGLVIANLSFGEASLVGSWTPCVAIVPGTLSTSGVLSLGAGTILPWFGVLQAGANANASQSQGEHQGVTADASHTGLFFLTPISDGAAYITESGLDYSASSVPEPGTLTTLGLGLPWLVRRSAARRR